MLTTAEKHVILKNEFLYDASTTHTDNHTHVKIECRKNINHNKFRIIFL